MSTITYYNGQKYYLVTSTRETFVTAEEPKTKHISNEEANTHITHSNSLQARDQKTLR